MDTREKATAYVATQRSLYLYEGTRHAFIDVLATLPEDDFARITRNLILMVLHEGAVAQVMHFPPCGEAYRVLQLTIPHDANAEVLRWVIAHELGHVMQGRNWQEGDGDTLEHDASEQAFWWGFPKTAAVEEYLRAYRARFGAS